MWTLFDFLAYLFFEPFLDEYKLRRGFHYSRLNSIKRAWRKLWKD